MKKRLLSFLMIMVLAVMTLSACGKDDNSGNTSNTPGTVKPGHDEDNNQGTTGGNENAGGNENPGNESGSGNETGGNSEDPLPPKFADLAMNNKFIDGIFTRDKIDYSIIANRLENCSSYSDIKELLFQYSNYGGQMEFNLDSDNQVESVLKSANGLKNDETTAVIVIEGNVTIDGNKIANTGNYTVNPATSTSGADYIVKSGSTLTYTAAGVSLSQGYSSERLPIFIVEENAKLIIEGKSYFNADEMMFFICKGGTLEIKDSSVDMAGLINLGTVIMSASNPQDYEGRCWGTARDVFINGKNATFTLNEAAFDAMCEDSAYRYGYWYTEYFNADYGKYLDQALDYAFTYNPHCYNFGTIDINCSGEQGLEFDATVYDEKLLNYIPGVNTGTINVNGMGRNQLQFSCHFQNYGEINLKGSLNIDRWGESEDLADGHNAYFENYGVIDCGSGTGNGMTIEKYFLNYSEGRIIESRSGKYYSIMVKGKVFDNVVAANELVTADSTLMERFEDAKWKATYNNQSDNAMGEYATFYCYNHEVSVDFSIYFDEQYVYFYTSANLYNVFDGEKMVVERTSDEYGGRSVLTIIPADDFSYIDYEIVNDTYGKKSGRVMYWER